MTTQRPDQRMNRKYVFDDPDMDLFFVSALSFGPTGGLDLGQAFHVASTIKDGDADSWGRSFSAYGDVQSAQADAWKARGWRRAAGEARLKAFASYRSAWQFEAPGAGFAARFEKQERTFAAAMDELELPATFFEVPFKHGKLPGVFFQNGDANAPVVFVIGGADTSYQDLFLSVGRSMLDRGYSVAIADLPGQGITMTQGLHWEVEAEKPIAAIIDVLVERFGAVPGRIALLGLSLGGYFVTRAAGHETRLATVMATTPFPNPAQLFRASAETALKAAPLPDNAPAKRNRQVMAWKLGASTPQEFLERTKGMVSDPSLVTVPFLSIVGEGDSPIFVSQAREWHASIRSTKKSLASLDAATGADGHCQVQNRLRLVQECCGWMDEIFTAEAGLRSAA